MPRMRAPRSIRACWTRAGRGGLRRAAWPGGLLEKAREIVGNETAARGIDMAVAARMLAMGEEALRNHQMQMVAGAGHGDIEQAALLLDLGAGPGREVGRDAAVHHIEQKNRFPFLSLGGMDGRKDQIILVEQGNAGLGAGGVGRIERQFGQKSLARGIGRGDLFELDEIDLAGGEILVQAFEMRLVPKPRAGDFRRPAGAAGDVAQGGDESRPVLAGFRAAPAGRPKRRAGRWPRRSASSARPAVEGPTPGRIFSRRKPATRSRGFRAKRSSASMSLTWALSRNFSPPNLTKGILRRVSSISSGPL